jgi:hypothetical protein
MERTDRNIRARSGSRWCRVALATAAIAVPMTGLAIPAAAATTTSSAGVHATAPATSAHLLSVQHPAWWGPGWGWGWGGGWGGGGWWGYPGWW